jgi:acetyl esterase/lipase
MGEGDTARSLPFPYGVSDFAELFGAPFDSQRFATIPFWIGVGAQDVNAADVPRQWDPYVGDQRVRRAERFATLLRDAGIRVEVRLFPQTGHDETNESRAAAMSFLASLGSAS